MTWELNTRIGVRDDVVYTVSGKIRKDHTDTIVSNREIMEWVNVYCERTFGLEPTKNDFGDKNYLLTDLGRTYSNDECYKFRDVIYRNAKKMLGEFLKKTIPPYTKETLPDYRYHILMIRNLGKLIADFAPPTQVIIIEDENEIECLYHLMSQIPFDEFKTKDGYNTLDIDLQGHMQVVRDCKMKITSLELIK